MKGKKISTNSTFYFSVELKKEIAFNIENFYKNHLREGVVGSGQNMAARKDSWNPVIMKNENNLSNQVPRA